MNMKWLVCLLLGSVMVFHIGAVWFIRGQRYELTSSDYYQRELTYQETIDRYRRGHELVWQIRFDQNRDGLRLEIRDDAGKAVVLDQLSARLYRPNGAEQDRAFQLETISQGDYGASFEPLAAGRWNFSLEGVWQGRVVAYRNRTVL